jgi:hypothetical protein
MKGGNFLKSNRWRILFTFLLIFPVLFSSFAQAEVLPKENSEPAYDGFLVSIREEYWEDYLKLPKVFSVVAAKQISKDHRLMQFSDMEVVQNWFPEEAIAFYEPNYIITLLEDLEPPVAWNLTAMDMDITRHQWTGEGVRVAIIDTGLYTNQPDLDYSKIEVGWNYAADNTDTNDTHGHGTFVTGVMAAISQNGIGTDGVAPGITIVPLKVTDENNASTVDRIISAIQDAITTYDCDIINISMGTVSDSISLREVIEGLPNEVIMVAAAGNNGDSTYQYPAAYPGTISVGSVNNVEIVSTFSQKNDQVTIVAPGEFLTGLRNTTTSFPNTVTGSGTSFAAPHVAGAAALAKQAKPNLTAQEFRDALTQTAKDLGEVGYDISYGYGLIQIDALMDKLLSFGITPKAVLESEQSKTWQLDFDQMPIGENIEVLIAGFQTSGRMESLLLRTVTPDQYRSCQLLIEMPVTEETAKIKIFLLSSLSSGQPRWPSLTLYQKP